MAKRKPELPAGEFSKGNPSDSNEIRVTRGKAKWCLNKVIQSLKRSQKKKGMKVQRLEKWGEFLCRLDQTEVTILVEFCPMHFVKNHN